MKQFGDISKAIHKEGYIFIVIFAAVSFLFASLNSTLGWLGFIATAWCAYFFRNPQRQTPIAPGLIISPADGIIQQITESPPPAELGIGSEPMKRISIFLSVFDVHVNRIPTDGKIISLHYNPGKFFNASLDKASIHNERQSVLMEAEDGTKIAFVQIAGLIARRIVCDLEEDTKVRAGERFGIIRFGSRVDVYLPVTVSLLVTEGMRAIGGETIFADLTSKKLSARKFEVR